MYNTTGTNDYPDPLAGTGSPSQHHRWANPDVASGLSKKINNSKNGSLTTSDTTAYGKYPSSGAIYNDNTKNWTDHDVGPNSEAFSFHPGGCHMVFADGHVTFVRATLDPTVIRALVTRDQGKNEADANFE